MRTGRAARQFAWTHTLDCTEAWSGADAAVGKRVWPQSAPYGRTATSSRADATNASLRAVLSIRYADGDAVLSIPHTWNWNLQRGDRGLLHNPLVLGCKSKRRRCKSHGASQARVAV